MELGVGVARSSASVSADPSWESASGGATWALQQCADYRSMMLPHELQWHGCGDSTFLGEADLERRPSSNGLLPSAP
jgi:hypothetical protein